MSTKDVPGANKANADKLKAGCWAEHEDGSLIYVKGTEADQVIYEIFDMAIDPPVSYTDAMPRTGFMKQFSVPPVGTSKIPWTWHDKTPFPWDRVMKDVVRPRPSLTTAKGLMSAARRVAESLRLRGQKVTEDSLHHQTDAPARRGRAVMDRIADALEQLANG
jgi:hypothetical protein